MYYSLHNHTDFSNMSCGFMDSINKVEDLINYAYKLGLKGIAITDHESVSAHVRAIQHYKSMIDKASEEEKEKIRNFRLMLGNEVYIARSDLSSETHEKGEKFFHCVLVAKNKRGQEQIRDLSSRAWGRSYFRAIQRRFNIGDDFVEVIAPEQGNVIATTACLGGFPGRTFSSNDPKTALEIITGYLERMEFLFGKNNFFIELAPSEYIDQINYNQFMFKHFNGRFPFVIATDSHYLNESDFGIFKTLLNSGDGEREVDDFYKYSHVMTWDEIKVYLNYLPDEFIEQCRLNTLMVGDAATFYDLKSNPRIPTIPIPEMPKKLALPFIDDYPNIQKFATSEFNQDRYYLAKIFENFEDMIPEEKHQVTLERIDQELEEIWGISEALNERMSDYLITVSKVIDLMWNEADALVGPGRGSAVAFVTNYLLGITQLNPLEYPVPIPHWRFIEKSRPDLPDIDIDTAGNKRDAVIREVSKFFESIGGSLTQICTYGTEGAKSAIRTAARGLNLDDEVAMYISSLVPSERGIQLDLKQCRYGDEEHQPIAAFVTAMESYPKLWEIANKIEGLITRMGVHAAGVILSNEDIKNHNSLMRSKTGVFITAYDLHDSEYMGGVKYDLLSIDGLGKIHAAINFMLRDNIMKWQGSLRKTYTHYLWPDRLKYNDALWANIASNTINSLWQLNTDVGTAALSSIHATSIKEVGIINSLMRLQPQNKGEEQPLKTYERFKTNISEWYDEMRYAGLNTAEIKIMEKHLLILNGIADTQESVMQLTMDPEIANFTIAEANKLRKGIAKKSVKAQEEAKKLLYEKGRALGTRIQVLDYVWNKQIGRQLGYSFSLPHIAAYSTIAMQQANLYTHFPSIYWNTACLSVDAGANQEEDLQELILKGYIKPSDGTTVEEIEEDEEGTKRMETSAIDRGKIAAAIGAFQKTMRIEPPDINLSGFGFTPDIKRNAITCGLKVVSKVGDQLIYNIIHNRPYISFDDFIDRVTISKDRVVNLIKADAFRSVDSRDRMTLLRDFVMERSDLKKKLTLQNMQMLITHKLIPDELDLQRRVYMWVKYIRKFKNGTDYILDERALSFYEEINLDQSKLKSIVIDNEVKTVASKAYVDSYYESQMNIVRNFIKTNHDVLLSKLNHVLFMEEWNKYKMDSIPQGEMQSMRMYVREHELADIDVGYEISDFELMEEEESDGNFYIEGKFFPRYVIRHIVGTVINKDKLKSKITVLTPSGPVDVKIWKNMFAFYDQTLLDPNSVDKVVIQDSFFEIGTPLMLTGIKRGTNFSLKKYKNTKVEDTIMKINLEDNSLEPKAKTEESLSA